MNKDAVVCGTSQSQPRAPVMWRTCSWCWYKSVPEIPPLQHREGLSLWPGQVVLLARNGGALLRGLCIQYVGFRGQ